MAFCKSETRAFTDAELDSNYTETPALSPDIIPSQSDRTDSLLSASYLARYIADLKNVKKLVPAPSADSESVRAYVDALNTLKVNSQAEYCYYSARYKYAISQLFARIADATAGAATSEQVINGMVDRAIRLNRRLTDLTQIVNAITADQYSQAKTLDNSINNLNGALGAQFEKLQRQASILKSEAPAVEIKKRMVEYTKEKANSQNNLLSLYFFLDVVALGILFYVYKAA
jgi:transposase